MGGEGNEPARAEISTQAEESTEIWLLRDVTEQEQARADVERLSLAIEQTSEAVLITDPDAVIQYVNPAFERVTGYGQEEVIGKNPRFLQSGEQSREFYEELWAVITSGETWTGHLVNRKKDGSRYVEDASISPVCSPSGDVVGYVGVKRDITDELSLQAQLRQAQKMESVGQLAGGVAHDPNNLLSPMLGYAQLLLRAGPSERPHRDGLRQMRGAPSSGGQRTSPRRAVRRSQLRD